MHYRRLGAIVATVVLSAHWPCRSEAQSCDQWLPGEAIAGFNGVVNAMITWDPDGAGPLPERLVIGGSFTAAVSALANNIAMWDGANWQPLGAGVNNAVHSLAVFNENLIVGGDFSAAGGVAANRIAQWDGRTWQPLGLGLNGKPLVFTEYNGDLIVGGEFTQAGVSLCRAVARWNGADWQPVGIGSLNGSVNALAVHDGVLTVGGAFMFNYFGSFYFDYCQFQNNLWVPQASPPLMRSVGAMRIDQGELLVAGSLDGNNPGVYQWNSKSESWSQLGQSVTGIRQINEYDGSLIIAGVVSNGTTSSQVGRWNPATELWEPVGSGMSGTGPSVRALAAFQGTLFAGGEFSSVGAGTALNFATWTDAAQQWEPAASSTNGFVSAIALYNNNLIVAGGFTRIGGVAANRIARWDGTSWHPLSSGISSTVYDLEVYNGKLIACGWFNTAGGVSTSNIASWDGTQWEPLGSGLSSYAEKLTVWQNTLVAAGHFTTAGGLSAKYVARWNGTAWSAIGTNLNSFGRALAVFRGDLYVGGFFNGGVARWSTLHQTWQQVGNPISAIMDMRVYGNTLVVAGIDIYSVMQLNESLNTWELLGGGMGNSAQVYCLFNYDGDLIAGGSFATAGGNSAASIARWNGRSWQSLTTGVNASVTGLGIHDGNLIVGGYFSTAGSETSPYFARWRDCVQCVANVFPPEGGDNVVNNDELVMVITQWGQSSSPADINHDNIVNIDDLIAVITAWGPCP